MAFDATPDLPYLAETPSRGPGADLIGRLAAVLPDMPLELYAGQWRVTARAGSDEQRAALLLRHDVDELQYRGLGYRGPLKFQIAGPWTAAAAVHLRAGHRILTDHGARRDLAWAIGQGMGEFVSGVQRAMPGIVPTVQVDEPGLAAVLAGSIPTASGLGAIAPVDPAEAATLLGVVVTALREAGAARVVMHVCAPNVPWGVAATAGFDAVSCDVALLTRADLPGLESFLHAGRLVWWGALPTSGIAHRDPERAAETVGRVWRSVAGGPLPAGTVITPACGLARFRTEDAEAILRATRRTAALLAGD